MDRDNTEKLTLQDYEAEQVLMIQFFLCISTLQPLPKSMQM